MVTVWWSAISLIHYSFLNPRKTIISEKYAQQIDEMYQELTLYKNCTADICQQNGPNSSPRQCPTTCRTTNASKVDEIGLKIFASSTIFTIFSFLPTG